MFYIFIDKFKKSNHFLYLFNLFTVLFIVIPLFIVIINAFSPVESISSNASFINWELITSLFRSLLVATFTIFFVFLFSYPFALLITSFKSPISKACLIAFITSPLWSSFFVKLIGLKSFFEFIYGDVNSTRGLVYVIIGSIYVNLPIAILNFYNSLNHIPKNIVNASLDLGHTKFESIFRVIIPYTKESIMGVIFLVFMPAFTSFSVADFMNSDQSSKVLGQLLNNYASGGVSDQISKSRLSMVTLFISTIVLIIYLIIKFIPILVKKIKNYG